MTTSILFEHLKVATTSSVPTDLVSDFSLSVGKGEVVALIGESGAGKSTIGLSALGYSRAGCRVSDGKILFDGKNLAALRREDLRSLRGRRVAYVAQSSATAFNPAIRIGQQIAEASLVHQAMRREDAMARALDLAHRMSLPEPEFLFERFPHQLSGGQLQRLMTVMALICRPELIVLDEPTTAIDVTTQLDVLIALRNIIRQEQVACLYISHDLAVVAQMADRIVILRNGLVVEDGPAERIVTAPAHPYTRELIAAARPVAGAHGMVPEERPVEVLPAVLEVRNVAAHYGRGVRVLRDVNLSLRPRQCIAIIGESGSGKSTLARVLSGLLPASHGEIIHRGTALPLSAKLRSREQLQRIQLVLQHPDLALNARVTIGAAIGRPLELFFGLKGEAKKARIASLLEMVDLSPELAERYPGQLSGGQKQRVNLARAIAAEPDLLICDEVTSALDTVVSAHVLALLATLQQKTGTACIFITHDISKAAALADEIYVMHRGEVVESGKTAEILKAPQHDYTRTLLKAVPELRTDWLSDKIAELDASNAGPSKISGSIKPKRGIQI